MKTKFKLLSIWMGLILSFTSVTSFGVAPRPETLNAASVSITDAFVTSMGAHEPWVSDKLIRTFGKQGYTYYDLMAQMGYVSSFSGVWQTTFSHFEEGYYTDSANVQTTTADAGVNAPITIPIDPAQVVAGKIYARPGDQVINPNTGAQGLIRSVTGTTPNFSIVVQPTQQGETFGGVTAGDQIFIYSNTFPEGSDQPESRASQVTKFDFQTKIIKETVKSTGSENTNKNWFEFDGSWIYMSKGIFECEWRLKQWISNAALLDEPITSTTITTGERAMNGLLPQIKAYGYDLPYVGGTFSLQDMYAMAKVQYNNFAGKEFFMFDGIDLSVEVQEAIGGLFVENPIIYCKRGGQWDGINANEVDLGFKTITLAGLGNTYHLRSMECFSHPKGFGLPGYQYKGLGIVMPNGKNTDAVTKGDVPSVSFKYKELEGQNRHQRVWWTGGSNAPMAFTPNSTVDISQYNMLTEIGVEEYACNQMFAIERTS